MLISRLGFSASQLGKLNRSWSILLHKNFASNYDFKENDEPIKFSSTPAATWKAEYHRVPPSDLVWFTPISVLSSTTIFMIYFFILREENDIDERIYQPLTKTIEGIDQTANGFDFNKKPEFLEQLEKYNERRKAKDQKN